MFRFRPDKKYRSGLVDLGIYIYVFMVYQGLQGVVNGHPLTAKGL